MKKVLDSYTMEHYRGVKMNTPNLDKSQNFVQEITHVLGEIINVQSSGNRPCVQINLRKYCAYNN